MESLVLLGFIILATTIVSLNRVTVEANDFLDLMSKMNVNQVFLKKSGIFSRRYKYFFVSDRIRFTTSSREELNIPNTIMKIKCSDWGDEFF